MLQNVHFGAKHSQKAHGIISLRVLTEVKQPPPLESGSFWAHLLTKIPDSIGGLKSGLRDCYSYDL